MSEHEWPQTTTEQRAGTTTRVAVWRDYSFELRATEAGDGRSFSGYAAVFDSPTQINSWEGTFTETVQRGAFAKTLRERTPVLMFNHGKHPSVGDMPIGAITSIREDARGLFVEARLYDNPLVEPVRQAIEGGSITGMSFRFEAIKDKWSTDRTRRDLVELRVAEVGPVVFPAYSDTTAAVRDDRETGTMTRPQRYTKEERREMARRLQAGLPAIPGLKPKTRKLSATEKATRQRQVDALRARSGQVVLRKGASHAERIRAYEQVTGKKFDRSLIELRQRNPWAADIEEERQAKQRDADRRAARQASIDAANRRAADRAQAVAQEARKAEELRKEAIRTGNAKAPTPAEEWQARVQRRKQAKRGW